VTQAFTIERVDPAHVRVRGRLGFAEAATALARSGEVLDGARRAIEVNVAGLEDIDSATLAVTLAWAARAATGGVRLCLRDTPADLKALAHLCDAEPLLGIV
jgi:ABC-type transporter Mla MlaB component